MKTILCYGDSNTYGRKPGSLKERLNFHTRWTTILGEKLSSDDYMIIPEGLPGRALSVYDKENDIMSGLNYIIPCIKSHMPLDYVIVLLGTNDLKQKFNITSETIAQNLITLVHSITNTTKSIGNNPNFIIISTPILHAKYMTKQNINLFGSGIEQSVSLHLIEQEYCKKEHIPFLDISDIVPVSCKDGIHFGIKGHKKLAKILFDYITME